MNHAATSAAPGRAEPDQFHWEPSVTAEPSDKAQPRAKADLSPPKWFHPKSESFGDYGDDKADFDPTLCVPVGSLR